MTKLKDDHQTKTMNRQSDWLEQADMHDLQEVTRQLLRAKEKAERESRSKSEFIASMSHEIRTPMNAIIGMTGMALNTKLSTEQRHYLRVVHDSAESLLGIINDILDYSKIEAGQMDLEDKPFNLTELLESVTNTFAPNLQEKGVILTHTLTDDPETTIQGDKYRLRQILINLVGNAAKFTSQGAIHLEVSQVRSTETDTVLLFSVKDTGIGIAHEMQGAIFDKFSQADPSITRKFGGTGLGLAICKRLTSLLQGEIWVESDPGAGSTFFFTARFKKPASKAATATARVLSESPALPKLRILLVEDNDFNRQFAKAVLQKGGHQVIEAANGLEGLRRMAEARFDLVLMDVQMPELDGLEATRLIRWCEGETDIDVPCHQQLLADLHANIHGSRTPVVAMTARAMAEDQKKCLEAGMDDYLTKPFHPDLVFSTISRVLSRDPSERPQPVAPPLKKTTRQAIPVKVLLPEVQDYLTQQQGLPDHQVDSILQKAVQSIEQELQTAELAINNGDSCRLTQAASSLKGALGNLGLHRMADLAHRLELHQTRGREDHVEAHKEKLGVLRKGLSSLIC